MCSLVQIDYKIKYGQAMQRKIARLGRNLKDIQKQIIKTNIFTLICKVKVIVAQWYSID